MIIHRKTRHRYLRVLNSDDAQLEVRVRVCSKFYNPVDRFIFTCRSNLNCDAPLDRFEVLPGIDLGRVHYDRSGLPCDFAWKGDRTYLGGGWSRFSVLSESRCHSALPRACRGQ